MQQARKGGRDGEPDQEAREGFSRGDPCHDEGRDGTDADEAYDAAHAEDERQDEAHTLAADEGEQDPCRPFPAQALGAQDAVRRFRLGGGPVGKVLVAGRRRPCHP